MKKYIIIMIIITSFFYIKIPKYRELNHIHIINEIKIKCNNDNYQVILKEIIPIKDDNGIEYEYKEYVKTGNNIIDIKKEYDKDNYFFYKDIKKINTKCISKNMIINIFKIKKRKH